MIWKSWKRECKIEINKNIKEIITYNMFLLYFIIGTLLGIFIFRKICDQVLCDICKAEFGNTDLPICEFCQIKISKLSVASFLLIEKYIELDQ